jgi:hypothetical protein
MICKTTQGDMDLKAPEKKTSSIQQAGYRGSAGELSGIEFIDLFEDTVDLFKGNVAFLSRFTGISRATWYRQLDGRDVTPSLWFSLIAANHIKYAMDKASEQNK